MSRHSTQPPRPTLIGSFADVVRLPLRHRTLFGELQRRQVAQKYTGSMLGGAWMVIAPLLTLAVYYFVFGHVFGARWPGLPTDRPEQVALVLLTGLMFHWLLADCIGQAPGLVTGNPNFVKKIVFPIDLLPWVSVTVALVQTAITLTLLLAATALIRPGLPATAALLPIAFIPVVLYALAFGWLFAAAGVFFRDLNQVTGLLSMLLLFGSSIFFAPDALPPFLRPLVWLNPLTASVDVARSLLFAGTVPPLGALAIHGVVGAGAAGVTLYLFRRLRRAFADVV